MNDTDDESPVREIDEVDEDGERRPLLAISPSEGKGRHCSFYTMWLDFCNAMSADVNLTRTFCEIFASSHNSLSAHSFLTQRWSFGNVLDQYSCSSLVLLYLALTCVIAETGKVTCKIM